MPELSNDAAQFKFAILGKVTGHGLAMSNKRMGANKRGCAVCAIAFLGNAKRSALYADALSNVCLDLFELAIQRLISQLTKVKKLKSLLLCLAGKTRTQGSGGGHVCRRRLSTTRWTCTQANRDRLPGFLASARGHCPLERIIGGAYKKL